MSIAPVEIKMELINQKVKFLGTSTTNPENPITVDYLPPLGDGEGYLGLEVLVMSFAGCVSTGIVAMLRRMGKTLESYQMNVTGIKNETPLYLQKIEFELIVKSPNLAVEELERVVKKAEEISPVWIAIRNNVEVQWKLTIVE